MKKKLSFSDYALVGSMLFGMFFGAGNLIFPVHMGQLAGANVWPATLGFLVTAIGLPFLGVISIGLSKSEGLQDLASRIHPYYGIFLTVALYLTIGPFFALPRTGTVSYEIGVAPFVQPKYQSLALFLFTVLFFGAALIFSMRPSKILIWIGKILNPLFLIFLAILVIQVLIHPLGAVHNMPVDSSYQTGTFIQGFIEGYNTMDALAALAFGIIVVRTIRQLGIKKPTQIATDTVKSGLVSLVLMAIIYSSLAYIGSISVGKFAPSENGGIALAQIAQYYFGNVGSILLALIVTIACLKTAIGLITACSETFVDMFPNSFRYSTYVILFTAISTAVANVGLTKIILFSLPVLMFLYPLAITLILLALASPLFNHQRIVYVTTTACTLVAALGDFFKSLLGSLPNAKWIEPILPVFQKLPFFDLGMGWIFPAIIGLIIGLILAYGFKIKLSDINKI